MTVTMAHQWGVFSKALFLSALWFFQVEGVMNYEPSKFRSMCLEFEPTKYVANATINAHQYVAAGTTLQFPTNDPSCGRPNQTLSVDVCRIALNISTSARSGIISEMWLPESWHNRFLVTGNGGIDGCIKYEDINYGNKYGFAAIGSNNGHNGTGGAAFYHNDEVLKDYVYRSLHTITEAGKIMTTAFYSIPPSKSYYIGCSGGGRQGLKAAEMFPRDYDGIVIGAPANNFNNMTSWRGSFASITGPKISTNFIQPDVWQGLIHNEVLRQCDDLDGVKDGIIEDPTLCHFKPEALLCGNDPQLTNSTGCLSEAQVKIVRKVFSPLLGASGELVYPAMQPGSEVLASQGLYSGTPFPYSLDWFRYVVYNDPTFTLTNFTTADITAAQVLNPFNVQTFPSILSRHSKILLFHGQQDQQISSFSTERLYRHLASFTPISELDGFLRFFRISGMNHCAGGPGAWQIGQSLDGTTEYTPEKNVLAAMVQWVEEGVSPETVEGVKYVDDEPRKGVERVRRHCKFPLKNTYVGGDDSLAESWRCVIL